MEKQRLDRIREEMEEYEDRMQDASDAYRKELVEMLKELLEVYAEQAPSEYYRKLAHAMRSLQQAIGC